MLVAVLTDAALPAWRPAHWTRNPGESERAWIERMVGELFPQQAFSIADHADIALPRATLSQLVAHASATRDKIVNSGLMVNVGALDQPPINLAVDTSPAGRSDLFGLVVQNANRQTDAPVVWRQTSGAQQIDSAQLWIVATAVTNLVEAAYDVWQAAVDGIQAEPPTISTTKQIDALDWPRND